MAIEITPRVKIKIPIWVIALLAFCIILLILLLVSYFYFEKSSKEMAQALIKTPQEITLEQEIEAKEKELNLYKEKIDVFDKLLSGHKKTVNIFSFLERICLPNVWFTDFNFTSKEKTVVVSGQTDNFATLEHQIFVLKQEPLVKKLNVSGVSLLGEGRVKFTFHLTLDSQVLE